MKLIYQQMLAFFAILMTMMLIVGFLFTQFMTQTIHEQAEANLTNYADGVIKMTVSKKTTGNVQAGEINSDLFASVQVFARSSEIEISVYNEQRQRIYGKTGPETLTQAQWDQTFNGSEKIYTKRQDAKTTIYRGWSINGHPTGVVVATQVVQGVDSQITKLIEQLIVAFVIGIAFALLVAWVISLGWVRRIDAMQDATEELAEGEYAIDLVDNGNDELGKLVDDINDLAIALQEKSDEVSEQEERRKQFMANASHEMRTPLTTMSGMLEGLIYEVIPEDEKPHAYELMQNETQRLIRLVEENLDYEKLRTNKIILNKVTQNGYDLLNELVNQLQNKASNEHTDLLMTGDEQAEVYGDHDRLIQVFFNLINNAIQFTQNGQITVTITRLDHATSVSVQDTGIGMTKEQTVKIFERYYKADPSRMQTKGESGIGMAIVKQIIELHDGSIDIDSVLNVGTNIVVTLPDKNYQLNDSTNNKKSKQDN